ncbi:MAG TPA: 2-C-methyl-D-erythritol 4-phosphate cytidylyltransferase [Planctomycetes bacterium]|nr:2-C-methyl-D-erythritol 4-phosphate cytidylyltransferase [Planctomycetota bacterium]HIK60591.1 2-C-methyl-D-erythritol 4-phosphate cytidylyltransferase [Planctomycetota bacterium]
MPSSPFVSAVLLAAGQSTRMGAGPRKPFLQVEGDTILAWALKSLAQAACVQEVIVVAPPDQVDEAREEALRAAASAGQPEGWVSAVVAGGTERTDSVRAGTQAANESAQVILVHDAARPLVQPARIELVAERAAEHGAALLAVRVSDTIKTSADGAQVSGTLERSGLWAAQTPQAFAAQRFRRVLDQASQDSTTATDDAALFERYDGSVALVEGDRDNIKITTDEDLVHAAAILRDRADREAKREGEQG